MSGLLLLLLLAVPAILYLAVSHQSSARRSPNFRVGSLIVYRAEKASSHPEAKAFDIHPSPHGELYYYSIADYLRVIGELADGRIISVDRDNIRHQFRPDDANLRRATWMERFLFRRRFPGF